MEALEDKNAKFEDKVEAMDKGKAVWIGSKEEFDAIVIGVLEKRKIKLESGKDYQLQVFLDKAHQIAVYSIVDLVTKQKVAEGVSGSPEPLPILRFRVEGSEPQKRRIEVNLDLNVFKLELPK